MIYSVLVFAIFTIPSSTNILFIEQLLPAQSVQQQPAYAFHIEAHRNTTSQARQIVESVEENLNATHEALLDANLTDAFFHLGVARQDLSALNQGNATIGMYTVFPRPQNVETPLLGQLPPDIASSSPPGIISSSPPLTSSGTGSLIGGESITGLPGSTLPNQPAQPAQPSQPIQPNQPFQTFQPSQGSQPSQPSQGSQPSQSFQPAQPTQPTQPTQPSQPTQPIIPGQ